MPQKSWNLNVWLEIFKSNIADYQELKEVRYNKLLGNVLKGVDTYWLSEPIRTGLISVIIYM